MGASGQWLKSLMGSRNTDKSDPVKEKASSSSRGKRWKLWRSFSGELRSGGKGSKSEQMDSSNASEDCLSVDDHFSAAVAAVVRAPLKDFRVVRQEWAAVRIQTAFRGFLARRALRALKGIVRIQAIFRGRQVRKQAAITLRCMQALVRAQARVRASQVWSSTDGKSSQKVAHSQFNMMAIKPWETRLMTKLQSEPNKIPSAKTSEDYNRTRNRSPNPSSVRVRKNNITTRISAGLPSNQSSNGSAPSSECYYAESSPSSSACTFTSVSGPTPESSEKLGVRYIGSPSYMNLTESVKARRRSRCYNRFQRQSMDDFEFHKKSALGFGESRSSVGSDHAFNCSRGTYQR